MMQQQTSKWTVIVELGDILQRHDIAHPSDALIVDLMKWRDAALVEPPEAVRPQTPPTHGGNVTVTEVLDRLATEMSRASKLVQSFAHLSKDFLTPEGVNSNARK